MKPSSHFTEVVIFDKRYVVTEAFGRALEEIARAAEWATLQSYPDAASLVPVYLTGVGPKVIAVIKEYRAMTGVTLKAAKAAIDGVRFNGKRIALGKHPINRVDEIAQPWREAGATVEIPNPLVLLAKQAD